MLLVWAGSYVCWFQLVPMFVSFSWLLSCLVPMGWILYLFNGLVPMLVWAGSDVSGTVALIIKLNYANGLTLS